MTREHQGPLGAYVALCVAAAFLLAQSTIGGSASLLDGARAHAGQPAANIAQKVTLYVLDQIVSAQAPAATVPVTAAVTVRDSVARRVTQESGAVSVQSSHPKKHAATGPARGNAGPQAHGSASGKGHHGKADRAGSGRVSSDQPGHGRSQGHAKKHR